MDKKIQFKDLDIWLKTVIICCWILVMALIIPFLVAVIKGLLYTI